jgi:aminopeptidase N
VTAYTFTYANTPEDLCRTYLEATGEYLRMYDDMIGPYPFDKFAMVENWWQTGFGMPSFTLLGDRVIRLPFIVHTSYGHEILHNWWGNGVFVDYDGGNWCEGLTAYLADYTYKAKESEQAARDYRLGQLQGYLDYAAAGGRDFSLRRFTERDSPETQAVGYGKTMMVFHMVRRLLGDEAFFDGLRRFYTDYRFRKANWDDLAASFEAASGRSLTAWFEQWIGRPGAPVLTAALLDRDGDRVRIAVRQEDPVYDLQVPIRYEAGGEVRSQVVPLSDASVTVALDGGPQWVAIDPGFDIFRKLHRAEVPPALSQVLGMDSTVVVVGSRCSPEMAAALRELAADWSRNHDQIVVDEAEFTAPSGRGVWLFGEGDLVDALFGKTQLYGRAPRDLRRKAADAGNSLIACFQDPGDEEIPWTAVLPAGASAVPALGRKLPHYGSYSYLVFHGEENVDKGRWVVESSPLRLDLGKDSR